MDRTGYWMWTSGRKANSLSHVQSTMAAESYSSKVSWEEQAFAEDSAGVLGACVWPPRSYTCSFCRREFRSAQALGGHMNVHRRDRARLKQSPNAHLDPSTQLGIEYPAQSPTFVCNPNPNPNPSTNTIPPSLSSSRVLAQDTEEENGSEQNIVSPFYSSLPLVQEQPRNFSAFPPPSLSFTDLFLSDSKLHREKWKKGDAGCRDERDYIKTDSAVRSQGIVRLRSQTPDNVDANCEKRQRKDGPLIPLFVKSDMGERQKIDASFPFFARRTSHDRHHTRSKVLGLGPSPMDDIDLELRLGDPPRVK